jgi:hypothetical protein
MPSGYLSSLHEQLQAPKLPGISDTRDRSVRGQAEYSTVAPTNFLRLDARAEIRDRTPRAHTTRGSEQRAPNWLDSGIRLEVSSRASSRKQPRVYRCSRVELKEVVKDKDMHVTLGTLQFRFPLSNAFDCREQLCIPSWRLKI